VTADVPLAQQQELLRLYQAFNSRAIDDVLAALAPDVRWPNGWEGGTVRGHDQVRDYWRRQWAQIDPTVTPVGFSLQSDGRIAVQVHQVVRNPSGTVVLDGRVTHVYRFSGGLVTEMEIRE
jgi:ketosteroid isomerase-like protein